jgi:hypothetical protein
LEQALSSQSSVDSLVAVEPVVEVEVEVQAQVEEVVEVEVEVEVEQVQVVSSPPFVDSLVAV